MSQPEPLLQQPKSLLQLAGAPAHPSPLERSALVLIDIQREYADGALPLAGVHEAAFEAAKLLELARRQASRSSISPIRADREARYSPRTAPISAFSRRSHPLRPSLSS